MTAQSKGCCTTETALAMLHSSDILHNSDSTCNLAPCAPGRWPARQRTQRVQFASGEEIREEIVTA